MKTIPKNPSHPRSMGPASGWSSATALVIALLLLARGWGERALAVGGTVVAWGNDNNGQTDVPPGLSNVVAVASGFGQSLALRSDGTVVQWGEGSVPTDLTNVIAIACGYYHSLALKSDGTVEAWGDDVYGQCDVPTGLSNVVAIAGGVYNSIALKADGTVTMWGYGLGALASGLTNVIAIAAGLNQLLTLQGDGTVAAWDDNTFSQTAVPAGLSNVVGVAAGFLSSYALKSDGTVLVWGLMVAGGPNYVPATVPSGLTNVQALGAAGDHCVATLSDGTLTTWGLFWSFFWSSLGAFPATIPSDLTNAGAIAVGADHDLAVVGDLPPSFTAPLRSRSVPAGQTVQFLANATGSIPASYQWLYNGTNVPGATNPFLIIPDAQEGNSGTYWVVVSNAQGSITSVVATVTVIASKPAIVQQPTDQIAMLGGTAAFAVGASGSEPISFQWLFDGVPIPGANNPTLTLTNIQLTNSGYYQLSLSNVLGTATSAVARLDLSYPFSFLTTLTNSLGDYSATWGDYDNDGWLDLLVAGRSGALPTPAIPHLFHNNGDGTFTEVNVGFSQAALSVAWGDLDNDGYLDIVLLGTSSASLWHNQGNGTFTNLNVSLAADYATTVSLADFDNDGRLDILLGGQLYRNLGNNQFTNAGVGLPRPQYSTTAIGDYDGDGLPDVLIYGFGSNDYFKLYRNLGNCTFTNVNAGFTAIYPGAGAWLDFDGDGRLDVLQIGMTGDGVPSTGLYRNNGDGTFTPVPSGLPGLDYTSIAVADCDNDGQPDVYLSGTVRAYYTGGLYRGQPSGLFNSVVTPFPTNTAALAAWGDYDNDGCLDFAVSMNIGGQAYVALYHNDIAATNSPPTAPASASAIPGVRSITFHWSPGSDRETPTPALTYSLRVGSQAGTTDILVADSSTNGLRRIVQPGNAGERGSLTLTNLFFGSYYYAVQTVDSAFAGSAFTPEQVFIYAASTLPASNVTSSTAALSGLLTANGLPTTAYFEWGTGTNLINRTAAQNIPATATNALINVNLSGLLPGTSYLCCLVISNALGVFEGGYQPFLTLNVPQILPQITSNISAKGATLNALINPNGSPTVAYFEYGLTPDYGTSTSATNIGSGLNPVQVSLPISGLIGGQVYHYDVVATNAAGASNSADLLFATTQEPQVLTLSATNVGAVSAVLNGLVRPNTLPTWAYFQYGLTTNYGSTTAPVALGAGTNLVAVENPVSNLTRLTTYHYQVVGSNSFATMWGGDQSFTSTNDIIALIATNIGMTNANLNGLVNPNAQFTSVIFEYGPTTNYGSMTPPLSLAGGTNLLPVAYALGGLAPCTTYYFNVVATNADGVRSSTALSFQTLGQFSLLTSSLAGSTDGALAWGDYDKDGELDMLVSDSESTRIYHNLGGGLFEVINTAIPGVSSGSVAWGDFNNDGWLDILITGTSSAGPLTRIYRNNKDGTFSDINAGLPAIAFRTITWGDFDNDGRPDVLLVGDTNSVGVTLIYRNNGDGTFSNVQTTLPGFLDATAACADYDNDGRLDVLLTGRIGIMYSNVFTKLFHNDGNGTFHDAAVTMDGVRLGYADWGDYDGDGYPDLVLGGQGATLWPIVRLYHNNGDGTFSDTTGALPQFAPDAVAWGDYDNDGRPDILVRGQQYISSQVPSSSYSALLHNNGDGTFTVTDLPLPELWSSCGGWADYNNNGLLDFVISGNSRSGAFLILYQNNNPGTNTPPIAPENLSAVVSNGWVTLAWSRTTDNETPSNGLSYNVRVGLTPVGGEILSPLAASDGWRRVVGTGNAGSATFCILTNLAPGDYYWSVQAVDTAFAGSPFASEQSFVIPGPPSVVTLTPTNLLSTSATLCGSVAPNNLPTASYFQWGQSTNYGNTIGFTFTNAPGANFMAVSITGLTPATVYYYLAAASNSFGFSAGAPMQFQTVAPPGAGAIAILSGGTIQLRFSGTPGATYHVLTSSNLVNWVYLGAAINSNSNLFSFTDALNLSSRARFYKFWTP